MIVCSDPSPTATGLGDAPRLDVSKERERFDTPCGLEVESDCLQCRGRGRQAMLACSPWLPSCQSISSKERCVEARSCPLVVYLDEPHQFGDGAAHSAHPVDPHLRECKAVYEEPRSEHGGVGQK